MINHNETSRWLLHLTKFHLHLFLLLCKIGFIFWGGYFSSKKKYQTLVKVYITSNFYQSKDWLLLKLLSENISLIFLIHQHRQRTSSHFTCLYFRDTEGTLYIHVESVHPIAPFPAEFGRFSACRKGPRSCECRHIGIVYKLVPKTFRLCNYNSCRIGRPREFEPG